MTIPVREKWRNGDSTLGGWLSSPSAISAETMARAGFDYVCIDAQHGAIDYSDTVSLVRAVLLGGASPLVRVPWNEPGIIGKVLDAGAHGVIVPMVNTVDEARAVVRACRYAPDGARSHGPTVAGIRQPDYPAWAAHNVAVIPMVETREAVDNLDDILAVEGIDAVYVGPADLSLTLGLPPGNNDGSPAFDDALATVVAACARAGVVAGCHSTGTLTSRRTAAGFRMVTVTSDLVATRIGLAHELALARNERSERDDGGLY